MHRFNLHTLPPGQAMYTLHVARPDLPDLEEYDQVAPATAPATRHLTGVVIEAARDALVELYGPTVEVRVVINESTGEVLFASGQRGFRPIPVVLAGRGMVPGPEDWPDPYSVLIDLMGEVHDGLNDDSYLDYILGEV